MSELSLGDFLGFGDSEVVRNATAGAKNQQRAREEFPQVLRSVAGTLFSITYPLRCTLRDVIGDGNCSYRAMSVLWKETENEWETVKAIVVNHVMENFAMYKPSLIITYRRCFKQADDYAAHRWRLGRLGRTTCFFLFVPVFDCSICCVNSSANTSL